MSDVTISTQSQEWISFFISVGIPALVLIFFAIIGVIGGTELAARVRVIPRKIRKYVDEPNDPAIQVLQAITKAIIKKQVPPEFWIDTLERTFDQIEKPAQEVNVVESAK